MVGTVAPPQGPAPAAALAPLGRGRAARLGAEPRVAPGGGESGAAGAGGASEVRVSWADEQISEHQETLV